MQPNVQTQAFDSTVPPALVNSVGFLLNEAAIVIREMDEVALATLGINPRQLGILMTIRVEGPQPQQAIGRKHRIDRTTMVKLTDVLEQRGLVVRAVHKSDRRCYALSLTAEGETLLEQGLLLVKQTQDRFLCPLTDAEWGELRQFLIRLLAHRDKLLTGETE
jgi:DNA-binding MarR family transcriptional regulator